MRTSEKQDQTQRTGEQRVLRRGPVMEIEVLCRDRIGNMVYLNSSISDTIKDLKKRIEAKTGNSWHTIVLKNLSVVLEDHVTLGDYNFGDCVILERSYQ